MKRRNSQGSIFNESGVWRFRELLNFCQIDTEDNIEECSKYFSFIGWLQKEDNQSHTKCQRLQNSLDIASENVWLQPEGYNPSGSFKDNGMATAVTHAKMVGAKKIVCASTGNTSASAGMFAANEDIDCDVYIPAGQIAPGKLKSSIPVWSTNSRS